MSCFYEKGLRFLCQRCSRCCRISPGFVYLSATDLTNLCQWFKLTEREFVSIYCRRVPFHDGTTVLGLREKKNYDCIFWNNGCTVYGARPVQCSTYPFWSWILEDEHMWNSRELDCPGIDCGELWTKADIDRQRNMYEQNEPLRLE